MRIDRLFIHNYRCFENREFRFDRHFNLLVGDNAAGKSSLFEAAAVAAGSWLLGVRGLAQIPTIDQSAVRVSMHRHADSLTFEKQFPAWIEAEGCVMGRCITWARRLTREGGKTTTALARSISSLSEEAASKVRAGEAITLPLVASYATERLWFQQSHHAKTRQQLPSRLDGYRDCFADNIQETELIDWMAAQQSVAGEPIALSTVKDAIRRCVGGSGSISYDMRYKDLVVDIGPSGPQFFRNLSDGQRVMLSFVGELARRIATLNPHLGREALAGTPGVVLIDELDLHLHPTWQRRVIADLKNTFPLVQFIATTHSPQLIGEALPREIMILQGGETHTPPRSFGIDSSRILEEVMGADSRDPAMEELLSQIAKTIDEEDFDTAARLIATAEEKLGDDDPEITRARALLAFLQPSK